MKLEPGKVLILALFLFAAGKVEARVYKWVDENGETHYSEQVPVGQQEVEVHNRATIPSAGRRRSGSADQFLIQQEMDNIKRKSSAEDQARAAAAQAEAMKKGRCAQAKQELNFYQMKMPIAIVSAQGEKNYLSDADRAAKVSNAQRDIAEYCN